MSRIRAQQDAQVLRAALPLLTLHLIAQQEAYGYEIVERLLELGLDVTTGLIYPVLARHERDHLVSSRLVASTTGPPRKYFALTPAGVDAYNAARSQWQQVSAAVTTTLNIEENIHD